jgi:hypothetical protein
MTQTLDPLTYTLTNTFTNTWGQGLDARELQESSGEKSSAKKLYENSA